MCENHELSPIFAFFVQNLHSEKAPGVLRRRRGWSGGVFRGGVRPKRVLRGVPGRPWGRILERGGSGEGLERVLRDSPGRPLV